MRPRSSLALLLAGLLGTIVAVVALRPLYRTTPAPAPGATSSTSPYPAGTAEEFALASRAFRLAAERPDLDRTTIDAQLAESDSIVAALNAQGVEDVGDEVHRRLNAVQPSDEDLLAWFEAHPEHFGDRSFEQSRDVLARLVAIEQVQADLKGLDEGE